MTILSQIYYAMGAITFFFADIVALAVIGSFFMQFLLCYLITISITKKQDIFNTNLSIILLALESFLSYNRFGFDIGILIFIVIIARKIRKVFKTPYITASVLLLIYNFIKIFLLENILLGLQNSINYIILQNFANILLICIILKFLIQGRRAIAYY